MLKIAFIALTALPLFAGFFPTTTHTSIASMNKTQMTLKSTFSQKGMSGVVIHHYGDALSANLGYLLPTKQNHTFSFLAKETLHHPTLPTIKTPPSLNDTVIGGYLYQNVLLLAPNAAEYHRITSQYHKTWIDPDLYALFLSKEEEREPTKANLAAFAKKYQVGLIYIVQKESAILLDPISGKIVAKKRQKSISKESTHYPFFMHFKLEDTTWFSKKEVGTYYQTMESL